MIEKHYDHKKALCYQPEEMAQQLLVQLIPSFGNSYVDYMIVLLHK